MKHFAFWSRKYRLAICSWIIAATLCSSPVDAADLTGQATVIDGDTIEIHGQRIRLYGIDAPEDGQTCKNGEYAYRCGQEAALALADRISGETIICYAKGSLDRYGRVVAVCRTYFTMTDLAIWMVDQGWALTYPRYCTDREYCDDYRKAEREAKDGDRGMWRGVFIAPWDWRKGAR